LPYQKVSRNAASGCYKFGPTWAQNFRPRLSEQTAHGPRIKPENEAWKRKWLRLNKQLNFIFFLFPRSNFALDPRPSKWPLKFVFRRLMQRADNFWVLNLAPSPSLGNQPKLSCCDSFCSVLERIDVLFYRNNPIFMGRVSREVRGALSLRPCEFYHAFPNPWGFIDIKFSVVH